MTGKGREGTAPSGRLLQGDAGEEALTSPYRDVLCDGRWIYVTTGFPSEIRKTFILFQVTTG